MVVKIQASRIGNPRWIALILCLTVIFSAVAFGQDQQPPRRGAANPRVNTDGNSNAPRSSVRTGPDVIMSSDGDYQVAISDVVEIIIEDASELSGSYRINKTGAIPMKYLGTMVIAGKTPEEIGNMIADGLRGRYLKDPKVYVTVKQYNSRTFFIQGSVRSPGVYVIEGRPSLFKLISIAGGMTENHGSMAYIIRETKVNPEKLEMIRAGQKAESKPVSTELAKAVDEAKGNLSGIEGESEYELLTAHVTGLFRGRFEQNLIIQPNDLVYIPPADVFFVAGEVKAPGQFPLREGTTLRQAISLAQGTYFKSATNRGIIFRQDPVTGKLNEIAVDIGAVMSGKREDIPIMPNDVIMVPNSKIKTVTGALLMSLGNAAALSVPMGVIR